MKLKQILLYGLILFATKAYPNIDSLKKVLATKDFKEVQRYVYNYRKASNHFSAFTFSENKVDSYYCISFQLQTLDNFDSILNANINLISVKLIYNNLDIFYYSISEYKPFKINKDYIDSKATNIFEYIDTIAFNIFIHKYKPERTNINEIIDVFFPEKYIYGNGCGFSGITPNARLWMEGYIQEKDSIALFSWLISPHLGLKTYAIEGLYKLEKSGMYINDFQWQAIKYIINSNSSITTCGGCMLRLETIKDLCKGYIFKKT